MMADTCCTRFTAAEGGTRLAAAASSRNILVVEYSGFIAVRLVCEEAYNIRGLLSQGQKRSIYVTRRSRVPVVAYELKIMTDLNVVEAIDPGDVENWSQEMEVKEVLVCTSEVFKHVLEEEVLKMTNINVMVLDSCHLIYKDDNLKYIMKLYKECSEDLRPRILGLTYPLFSSNNKNKQKDSNNTSDDEKDTEEDSEATENTEVTQNREVIQKIEVLQKKEVVQNTEVVDREVVQNTEVVDRELAKNEEFGVIENLDDYDMYEKLEYKISELEDYVCCQMDLAEDIDGGKRISTSLIKPRELIIEYGERPADEELPSEYLELEKYMKDTVNDALAFLNDHRHDPTEIYGEELYDEFKNIPDPTTDPKNILMQFLYLLDQLGPYGADKAAFSLLINLEKLKIKIPYERHFLLLCFCTTVLIKIRGYAEYVFNKCENDWDKIRLFSTPKVLRFAEILQKFHPNVDGLKNNTPAKNERTARMLSDIEKCDFNALGDALQDKLNTHEANLKEIHEHYVDQNCIKNDTQIKINNTPHIDGDKTRAANTPCIDGDNTQAANTPHIDGDNTQPANTPNKDGDNTQATNTQPTRAGDAQDANQGPKTGFRRSGHRVRGRGRIQRSHAARLQMTLMNPDALCGIVFIKEPLMAKILFMMIVDMSRFHPKLSYLCAQYCAVEHSADPMEPKECQRQGKKQEDVLKKFRMHECNLLLATPALEEGIDLPRCNLVLRWDVPPSYRSYGLSRGRARAPRAAAAVLSPAHAHAGTLLRNLAVYRELDQIVTRKCGCGIQNEPPQEEEDQADTLNNVIKPYTPLLAKQNEAITTTESDTSPSENTVQTDVSVSSDKVSDASDKDSDVLDKVTDASDKDSDAMDNVTDASDKVTDTSDKNFPVRDTDKSSDVIPNNTNIEKNHNKTENLENLVCNKCAGVKPCASAECLCVTDNSDIVRDVKTDNIKYEVKNEADVIASVDLNTAIALINRYCGKLPSDTFTRLAPQWWVEEVQLPQEGGGTQPAYICTLRLPLNCPVKYNIVGHPMPTRVLARRMVALQACRILHKSGELDDNLMPIGKENFKAAELKTASSTTDEEGDDTARPGTTKRRQYYYKRTAWAFTDCQPVVDTSDSEIDPPDGATRPEKTENTEKETQKGGKRNMLYALVSRLWCALPERYNTRGRRLHAPQHAAQALGLLMARDSPTSLQIPAFPVYTRSGEVRVSVKHVPDADVRMSPRRGRLVRRFMRSCSRRCCACAGEG